MARTSSSLQNNFPLFIAKHQLAILGVFTCLSLAIFLAVGFAANKKLGFPLDDSWIHQTYARNLAENGEWAFVTGEPSAGSTSPLWVALLAIGYFLRVPYFIWTFGLGFLILWSLALVVTRVFRRLFPKIPLLPLFAGLLFVFEWHLVWAAASGMETLLFGVLSVALFAWLLDPNTKDKPTSFWLAAGAIAGLTVWVRPEGLTLLLPLSLAILSAKIADQKKLAPLIAIGIGFLLLFLPYLAFNYSLSGSIWPNTFYAKQAEALEVLVLPISVRLGQVAYQLFVGVGLLLLPGAIYLLVAAIRKRDWFPVIWASWVLAYLLILAIRLPLSVQHGRYAMPVMPIFFLLGLMGLASAVPTSSGKWFLYLSAAWKQGTAILLLGMFALAAPAYATDVSFIETEMVTVADWLRANTPPDALIASHDIGAIGFFSDRRVLDLAGLVTPEVIPFLHDEDRLAEYLDTQNADFLVSFVTWYPQLIQRSELVFQTHGTTSTSLGGENMAVYRWFNE
jgi:arabinofuranosyltransferase